MRKFEKINFKQFELDICNDAYLYENYHLPVRSTQASAGYDFESVVSLSIKPGEIVKIPTGIKALMETDEVLILIIRSSMGFKYNIRLCNQIGVIDKDYYGNKSNDGHIWIALKNEGSEVYKINKGDKFCQGIFIKYLKVDDDIATSLRSGGIGSTN